MKSNINLLPKEDQKAAVLERIESKLTNFFVWILLSLLVLSALLFTTRLYLKSELSRVRDRVVLQQQVVAQQDNRELKLKLDGLNTHLQNLVTLDESQGIWSEVLIELARLVPKDTSIDTLIADRITGQVRVIGFSKQRDSVLEFRNSLLDSDFFKDVNFPLSNLVTPTDVDFHYTFSLNEGVLIGEEE